MNDSAARFWAKAQRADGCWDWQGATMPNGYGALKVEKVFWYAHRRAWLLTHGDPGDLHVLHRCDNRRCVRPEHLFLGTRLDNMRDMAAKGRGGNQNKAAAACKRGHAFDGANTYTNPRGERICRACQAAWMRQHRAKANA